MIGQVKWLARATESENLRDEICIHRPNLVLKPKAGDGISGSIRGLCNGSEGGQGCCLQFFLGRRLRRWTDHSCLIPGLLKHIRPFCAGKHRRREVALHRIIVNTPCPSWASMWGDCSVMAWTRAFSANRLHHYCERGLSCEDDSFMARRLPLELSVFLKAW